MFECPECGGTASKVRKSVKYAQYVYRRRECLGCGCLHTTNEVPESILSAAADRLEQATRELRLYKTRAQLAEFQNES